MKKVARKVGEKVRKKNECAGKTSGKKTERGPAKLQKIFKIESVI